MVTLLGSTSIKQPVCTGRAMFSLTEKMVPEIISLSLFWGILMAFSYSTSGSSG